MFDSSPNHHQSWKEEEEEEEAEAEEEVAPSKTGLFSIPKKVCTVARCFP
jgi:hypothetical protein